MDQSQDILRWIGNVLIVWAALVGTASVVVHLRVFDRRSTMSRHLLAYMTALAVVLVLSCIRILFGDTWWFALLRLVTFVAVPVFMTQRLILQIRAQLGGAASDAGRLDRPADPES